MALLTPARSGALVAVAALGVYASALGNGFAYDDVWVVESNPVVTERRLAEAFTTPYWPQAASGTGNYRPLTVASFGLEWALWDGDPLGFHAVNVLVHVLASLLVLALLLPWVGPLGGLVGGLLFAVHPVHVEAVANVVGRAELYAAVAVLAAVLLHRRGASWIGGRRGARIAGVAALYAVGLGSKEMAVTLPALLLLVDLTARRGEGGGWTRRLRAEAPVYLVLGAVLAGYLVLRWSVVGAVTGEIPSAGLGSLDTGERLLSALAVWPHYLRLMVAPADLIMDYRPGVLPLATGVDLRVVAGALLLLALLWGAVRLAPGNPVLSLGLGWFLVTVLPVSNLVVRADVLLAERTLYLPSVGLALVAGGLVPVLRRHGEARGLRLAGAVAAVALVALGLRTMIRNPAWRDTPTAMATLAAEHPESFLSWRTRARMALASGRVDEAAVGYEGALELAGDDYPTVVEAAGFFGRVGAEERARALFRQAVAMLPDYPAAYRRWGEHLLRNGRGREAHRVALEGLARAGPDRELYNVVSESYVAKGDLEAAVRARRAALGQPGATRNDAERLAVLLERLGRPGEAADARARAGSLADAPPPEAVP